LLVLGFGCNGSHKWFADVEWIEAAVVEAGRIESWIGNLGRRGLQKLGFQRVFEIGGKLQVVGSRFQYEDVWVLAPQRKS
jgi:hypothetical protein